MTSFTYQRCHHHAHPRNSTETLAHVQEHSHAQTHAHKRTRTHLLALLSSRPRKQGCFPSAHGLHTAGGLSAAGADRKSAAQDRPRILTLGPSGRHDSRGKGQRRWRMASRLGGAQPKRCGQPLEDSDIAGQRAIGDSTITARHQSRQARLRSSECSRWPGPADPPRAARPGPGWAY